MIRRILTHNGEPGGRPIGVGFYHADVSQVWIAGVVKTVCANDTRRWVWVDVEGRAVRTAWFREGFNDW